MCPVLAVEEELKYSQLKLRRFKLRKFAGWEGGRAQRRPRSTLITNQATKGQAPQVELVLFDSLPFKLQQLRSAPSQPATSHCLFLLRRSSPSNAMNNFPSAR